MLGWMVARLGVAHGRPTVVLGPTDLDTGLRKKGAREKGRSAKGQRPAGRAPDAKVVTCGGGAGKSGGRMRRRVGKKSRESDAVRDRERETTVRESGLRREGVRTMGMVGPVDE